MCVCARTWFLRAFLPLSDAKAPPRLKILWKPHFEFISHPPPPRAAVPIFPASPPSLSTSPPCYHPSKPKKPRCHGDRLAVRGRNVRFGGATAIFTVGKDTAVHNIPYWAAQSLSHCAHYSYKCTMLCIECNDWWSSVIIVQQLRVFFFSKRTCGESFSFLPLLLSLPQKEISNSKAPVAIFGPCTQMLHLLLLIH